MLSPSRGLLRSGVGVETVNCEFTPKEEIAAVIKKCCGFVLGSPTLAGHMPTPVQVRACPWAFCVPHTVIDTLPYMASLACC